MLARWEISLPPSKMFSTCLPRHLRNRLSAAKVKSGATAPSQLRLSSRRRGGHCRASRREGGDGKGCVGLRRYEMSGRGSHVGQILCADLDHEDSARSFPRIRAFDKEGFKIRRHLFQGIHHEEISADVGGVPIMLVREHDHARAVLVKNFEDYFYASRPMFGILCAVFRIDSRQSARASRDQTKPDIVAGAFQFVKTLGMTIFLLPCVTATLMTFILASRNKRKAMPPEIHSSSGCGKRKGLSEHWVRERALALERNRLVGRTYLLERGVRVQKRNGGTGS